jgi:anti-sigma-K factor RskA
MDIQSYISSGIIERYALGLCTVAESSELESLALQHPEIGKEVDEIRRSLESYAEAHTKRPPAALKERLMESISVSPNSISTSAPVKIRSLPGDTPTSQSYLKYAVAASLVLLLGSASLNYLFYKNWKTTENLANELTGEKNRVALEMQAEKTTYVQALKDLSILKNPEMVKMEMKGTKPAPDAKALVYCNPRTNELFLDVKKLPAAPDSMQYQFWAIINGKPVDAGMIELCSDPDTCSIHRMNTIPDAHAFAISLERKGGNAQPKGEIYATFGI